MVRAEIAGMVEGQLEVVVDRGELTIRGERPDLLSKGRHVSYHEVQDCLRRIRRDSAIADSRSMRRGPTAEYSRWMLTDRAAASSGRRSSPGNQSVG